MPPDHIELISQVEALVNQISAENHEEESWHDLLAGSELNKLAKMTLSACHVVDYIGKNRLTNAIGIANHLNITKGGISKITGRLLQQQLIEAHRMEGNRKEIFYSLTPAGKKLFALHEKLHAIAHDRLAALFQAYTAEELATVNRFLTELMQVL
jgi:DNA-binding MarR family transcriptional regulator